MIGKIVLGESLKRVIGELKLSYRRIFRITGESLAAVRSALRGGGPGGIFIPKYAMKPRFFALLSFLYRHIFAWFWKTNPKGLSFYYLLMQGWRKASTLPCQKTNPDGVICEWKKNSNQYGLSQLNRKGLDAYKKKNEDASFWHILVSRSMVGMGASVSNTE